MIRLLIAMFVDLVIKDPQNMPHPVIGIGKIISLLEGLLYDQSKNKASQRFRGGILVFLVISITSFIVSVLQILFSFHIIGYILFGIFGVSIALACGSLIDIIPQVLNAYNKDGLEGGREKIRYFVSRDTKSLSKNQLFKTLFETLSENTVDGIIAPLFYAVIGELFFGQGVLWIWIYKSINTMDSMIAYKNERYMDFGFVAAKVDDAVNYIPARLGGLLLLLTGGILGMDLKNGWRIMRRDHGHSASPNAGYPEGACAGLLKVQIGGTYSYFGKNVKKATIGEPIEELDVKHIQELKKLILGTYVVMALIITLLYFLKVII